MICHFKKNNWIEQASIVSVSPLLQTESFLASIIIDAHALSLTS